MSPHLDFGLACRLHGRNDAFWALCYRRHLEGRPIDEREMRELVRAANRATGGLAHDGARERYTRYEATQTMEQVSGYPSLGLLPMVERCRHWAGWSRSHDATPPVRRLLEALCLVAESSGRHEFAASHRRLGAMAGISACSVAAHLRPLERHGLVRRTGFSKPLPGRTKGTSRFSIMPARPEQMIDEASSPRYDAERAKWTWDDPRERGSLSAWRYRRMRGSVPTVQRFKEPVLLTVVDTSRPVVISPRGSPYRVSDVCNG